MTDLERAIGAIKGHAIGIKSWFQPDARVTIIVRRPGEPDQDVVVTADDLGEVSWAVARAEGRSLNTRTLSAMAQSLGDGGPNS